MSAAILSERDCAVLDALDSAPLGTLSGEIPYAGPVATVQWLANCIGVSDNTARKAVLSLLARGLCIVIDGLDPAIGKRRLFVIGEEIR